MNTIFELLSAKQTVFLMDSRENNMVKAEKLLRKSAGQSIRCEYSPGETIRIKNLYIDIVQGLIIESYIENGHEKYICKIGKAKQCVRKQDIEL